MPIPSRKVIKELKKDGWFHVGTTGSHQHFKHPSKAGKVTVPHPKKDMTNKTVKSIEIQSGIRVL